MMRNQRIKEISLVGISFQESTRLKSFRDELKKTQEVLESFGVKVNQKIVMFQTAPMKRGIRFWVWSLKTLFKTAQHGAKLFLHLELTSAVKNPLSFFQSMFRYFARLLVYSQSAAIRHLNNPTALWNEAQLSSKHAWAWRYFIDNKDADLLIVLEDDATSNAGLTDQLMSVIGLFQVDSSFSKYFDLGAHYEYQGIYRRALSVMSFENGIVTAPFVANTTAAYAANRPFFEGLLTELTYRPDLANISADWMVMALVRLAENKGQKTIYQFLQSGPVYFNMSLLSGDSSLHNK
jgi:hypothetical protein